MTERTQAINDRVSRVRICFSRIAEARELSHIQQIKALRKAVCDSGLACVFSKCGKTPIAKMSFGPAISVGYASSAEYADIYLSQAIADKEVMDKLSKACPQGLMPVSIRRIPVHFPSIESLVNTAEYEITGEFKAAEGTQDIKTFLERKEIIITKVKPQGVSQSIDARPLIISMERKSENCVYLFLRFGPKKHLKPESVINSWLGISRTSADGGGNVPAWDITRKQLYWENSSGQFVAP